MISILTRRITLVALALIVALVAAPVPADNLQVGEGYTFSYVVPPKPGTPAMDIKPIPRPPGPPPWARNMTADKAPFSGSSTTATTSSTGYQTTGEMSGVLLAVDFDDNEAVTLLAHYDDMLFDPEGYPDDITKSMRRYYHEVSYYDPTALAGLDVEGEVYGKARSDPTDWVDWIRAPKSYKYYTSGNYGFGRYPRNAQKLTEDAVAAADPYVDFSAFTTYEGSEAGVSGTFVSALFVVHAGPGAEVTGSRDDIWSHSWVTSEPILTDDGVYVYRYIMMAEDSPMGTFGHEFGHTLGLPDLYDYDGSSAGVGMWSMMSYGTWADDGHTPVHMDAWCKIRAEWVSPTVITDTATVDIPQAEDNATSYQLWTNSSGTIPEYFLVENRQKVLFDAYLPGDGLLIWHIDDNVDNNNDEAHYHVALEQADGNLDLENWNNAGDNGDPFPGSTGNHTFDDNSTPNSKTYDGSASGVAVTKISDSSSTMTATMTGYSQPTGEIGKVLTVDIWTDKDTYTLGEIVYITVKVTDEGGDPVENATVHITIHTPLPISYGWDQATSAEGTTVFEFKPKWRGDYSTKADATYDGSSGSSVWIPFMVE
jgi:immune inhibitor A